MAVERVNAMPIGAPALTRSAGRRRAFLGGAAAVAAASLAALAVVLTLTLAREPPTTGVALVFGAGLLGSLALATVRCDLLVATGVLLLAVVEVEPAPADVVFGVAIAVALVTGGIGRAPVPAIVWLATLFVALNLLSAVEVVDTGRAAFYLAITVYMLAFALWLAVYVDSAGRAGLVVSAYVAAAVLSAAFASLALFVSFPGSELLVYGDRAKGLFKDPLVYAPFLVPPALIVAERAVAPRVSGLRRAFSAGLFATLAVGVLFSYSRAAWLNLAIGVIVMTTVLTLRHGGSKRVLPLVAIVLATGLVAVAAVRVTGSEQLLAQRTQLQRYDEQRFGAQLFGIDQSTRYPLGIGPGQFEVLSPVSAHSVYVRALAEQGLLGLLTLLGLFVATLGIALENVARNRETFGIGSAALLGAWCGLLANSLFVDTLHWRHLWLIAALIWSGALVAGRREQGR